MKAENQSLPLASRISISARMLCTFASGPRFPGLGDGVSLARSPPHLPADLWLRLVPAVSACPLSVASRRADIPCVVAAVSLGRYVGLLPHASFHMAERLSVHYDLGARRVFRVLRFPFSFGDSRFPFSSPSFFTLLRDPPARVLFMLTAEVSF